MPLRDRPLSPHLEVYRWQIGSALSILHRLTGIALALGIAALAYWLTALAGGEPDYVAAMRVFSSPAGWIFLSGWSFAFLYHLLSGVRHLFCDVGFGFERAQRNASGWLAVLGAVVLTACVGLLVWHRAHP
jgi:succinate dehydrogenase / fumarate reductase cytochrome b subunit